MSRQYSNFKILKEIKTEDGTKVLAQVDVITDEEVNVFLWFTKTVRVMRTARCVKDVGSNCFYDINDGSYLSDLNNLYNTYTLVQEFDGVDLS
jgi:hypothetical protein